MRAYLDHNASSPLRPEARRALEAALEAANPSSVHREGQRARGLVETARAEVAAGLGVDPADVVLSSGATEAINHAVFAATRTGRRRVVQSAVEHDAVRAAVATHAGETEICPVDGRGVVDLEALERLLAERGEETLVAVMAANNETGVVQPVAEVAAIAKAAGALAFVDAVQVFGRAPFAPAGLGADMAVVSGHKLGGPKGSGALYVRPGLDAPALVAGGGQERGRRGGTENVIGFAGFGAAARVAVATREAEAARQGALRDRLEETVRARVPDAVVFGEGAPRLPNTLAFAIPGRLAETLLIAFDLEGVAVSSGAACTSGKVGESHVLEAMGVDPEIGRGAIRVSLGWSTTEEDIELFARALGRVTGRRASASAAA